MTLQMWVAFGVIFSALVVALGYGASWALASGAPGRRRLRELETGAGTPEPLASVTLATPMSPGLKRLTATVPKSPKGVSRVQRRLATAGFHSGRATAIFVVAELLLPVAFACVPLFFMGVRDGWMPALIGAAMGWMIPGFWLSRQMKARKRQIQNGLPDALDLLIVCLESGSSIDQGVVKVSEELAIAYPALAEELRLITAEIRAGKPRMDAFKNFSDRTKVEDVRVLVAMLIQTDRFGTSMGQALRTHAETSRSKRRQRAEEHAAKLGVKLVFPLVLCLFPAFYVVVLGPMVTKFVRIFYGGFINQ